MKVKWGEHFFLKPGVESRQGYFHTDLKKTKCNERYFS